MNNDISLSELPRLGVDARSHATAGGLAEPTSISPCSLSCPLGINVQRYVGLAQRGQLIEALQSILEQCPLPGVCGYICQRPCEAACRRVGVDRAVAIRWIKRTVAGAAVAAGLRADGLGSPNRTTIGEGAPSIAVIGAGPAGLSAAWALAERGLRVVLFDRRERAGGLLDEVIPDFRLPRRILRADVARILAHPAITMRSGVDVGREGTSLLELESPDRGGPFAAVLLATGASIEGLPQLDNVTLAKFRGIITPIAALKELEQRALKPGSRAVVVGGTNAAVTTSRALKRAGWKKVAIAAGRSRELWPVDNEDLAAAEEEGIEIRDQFLVDEVEADRGRLSAIVGWKATPDALGRPRRESNRSRRLAADLLVVDTRRHAASVALDHQESLDLTSRGAISVDSSTLQTSRFGVFAAGECATGPKTVVEAMAAGKRAAAAIERYVDGKPLSIPSSSRRRAWFELAVIDGATTDGTRDPAITNGPIEVPASVVASEAMRCLRCGPCAECDRCDPSCRHERAVLSRTDGDGVFGLPIVYRAPAGSVRDDEALVALVDETACTGCGRCEAACPHQAVVVRFRVGMPPMAMVNRPACRGCGRCEPACPFGVIDLRHGDVRGLWRAISGEGSVP